jgi:hypothetical protein
VLRPGDVVAAVAPQDNVRLFPRHVVATCSQVLEVAEACCQLNPHLALVLAGKARAPTTCMQWVVQCVNRGRHLHPRILGPICLRDDTYVRTFVKAVLREAVPKQDELRAVHQGRHTGWLYAMMCQQRLQGYAIEPRRREDQPGAALCSVQHARAFGDAAQSGSVLRMVVSGIIRFHHGDMSSS